MVRKFIFKSTESIKGSNRGLTPSDLRFRKISFTVTEAQAPQTGTRSALSWKSISLDYTTPSLREELGRREASP